MAARYRVNDVASILGVSQTTVYKHFARMKDRLKPHSCKEKGIIFFDDDGLEEFRNSIGTADKESTPITAMVPAANQDNPRLESLEKAIMAMAEAHGRESAALRAQISELAGQVERLTKETTAVRLALAPPIEPPKPVNTWKPARLEPTLTWYQRAWFELTGQVERLRALEG